MSRHKRLRNWLENLSQESWQLELLISGFSILLLVEVGEPIEQLHNYTAVNMRESTFNLFVSILGVIRIFVLVNLILHVILRGVWVGAVGLRYVSGDIDYQKLNHAGPFPRFLRKQVGRYDQYIDRVERWCSVIFAFTFLIVFTLLSLGLFLIFVEVIREVGEWAFGKGSWFNMVVLGSVFFTGVLYFIDFFSLGLLKRNRTIARLYFPVYRFYGWVTLAFLYRPLLYNLIDNRFGRRLGLLLIPYILAISLFDIVKYEGLDFFLVPRENEANALGAMNAPSCFYLEERETAGCGLINNFVIPSKVIQGNLLELFIPLTEEDDQMLYRFCPGFESQKENGFFLLSFRAMPPEKHLRLRQEAARSLACISERYRVRLRDSLLTGLEFQFHQQPNRGEKGVLAMIDIAHLDRGKQVLTVSRREKRRDTLLTRDTTIPFWKD